MTGQTTGTPAQVTTTTVGQNLNLYGTPSITMASPGPMGAILDLSVGGTSSNVNSRQSNNNYTVLFRGPGLGGVAGANVSNVKLPSGMQTTVGSGSSGPAIGILPWAIGDGTVTGSGTDFVTYDPTNGVRLLAGLGIQHDQQHQRREPPTTTNCPPLQQSPPQRPSTRSSSQPAEVD